MIYLNSLVQNKGITNVPRVAGGVIMGGGIAGLIFLGIIPRLLTGGELHS